MPPLFRTLLSVLLALSVSSVCADDSDVTLTDYLSLPSKAWKVYNVSMIDWEPPQAQIPWLTVMYRTPAGLTDSLGIYAAIGQDPPTLSSPYKTNNVFSDPSSGYTTLTLWILNPPTDGGYVQMGVYNPLDRAVWINVTVDTIPDSELDNGQAGEQVIEAGSFQLFHMHITQQQADSKENLYYAITTEDGFEGFGLYARFGAYPLPNAFDFNITFQSLQDDGELLLFLYIPELQLKAGDWYFYLTAQDTVGEEGGGDDNINFGMEVYLFEEVGLDAGKPHSDTIDANGFFKEFTLPGTHDDNKNSPCLVEITFSDVSWKDLDVYAAADTIASNDNYDYQYINRDKNAPHLELVIPPGMASITPLWHFQVLNGANVSAPITITATYFPISQMSYSYDGYQRSGITLPAGAYHYIITNDLDTKGQTLSRLMLWLAGAPDKGLSVFVAVPTQDPDRSLPTSLNYDHNRLSVLSANNGSTVFCHNMVGSFSQPAYFAIYNPGSSSVNIQNITLDFPSSCAAQFVTPANPNAPSNPSNSSHPNNSSNPNTPTNELSVGFGGLGEYGLIAVVVGGFLSILSGVCCMHRYLKSKDSNMMARGSLQSQPAVARSSSGGGGGKRSSSRKSKRADGGSDDKYALLKSDRDADARVTAVEDL